MPTSECGVWPLKGGFISQSTGHGLEMCRWNLAGRSGSDQCYTMVGSSSPVGGRENLFKTFSPFFPPSPSLPPSGVDEVRDHITGVWPPVSLILLPQLGTHTAVQQHAHCASPFTLPPPPACRYRYKESKASCFSTTYLISASLGML